MASLFSMPTPEAIRQGARDRLFKQSVEIASQPNQRNLLAAQGGALFGQQVGKELGVPEVDPALAGIKAVQQATESWVNKNGIDTSTPEGQLKMLGKASELGRRAGIPMVYEAADAQSMAINKDFAAKEKKSLTDLQQIPGAADGTLGQQDLATKEWSVKVKPADQGTTVNVGEKESAKYSFNSLAESDTQAGIARNTMNNLKFIDKAIGDIETGALTEYKVAYGKVAKSFGLPVPDDISDLEAANSSMGDLVMGVLGKFKGAISNAEREFAASIVPRLTQTKEGRAKISAFMKEMSERAIEYNKQMTQYMSENNSNLLPQGKKSFNQQWNEYMDANPMFDEEDMKLSPERQKRLNELRAKQKG